MSAAASPERCAELARPLAPEVLGQLVRRFGSFGACEDAVQEALLAAVTQWPAAGIPDNPRAWLLPAASRRVIGEVRSRAGRRRREEQDVRRTPSAGEEAPSHDDSLALLFLCCHKALSPAS